MNSLNCASCPKKECSDGKDCLEIEEKVKKLYQRNDIDVLKKSTAIESRYYMQKTRLEEIILFSEMMDYQKIGLAFCIGLSEESSLIHNILKKHFKVYSACCKICGIDKEDLSLEKIDEKRYEAMCNPLGQAYVLNEKNTDLNIIIGLCIGHDILFTKNSNAPVTTLAVKDRVLAHNPLGAIYTKYYRNKLTTKR